MKNLESDSCIRSETVSSAQQRVQRAKLLFLGCVTTGARRPPAGNQSLSIVMDNDSIMTAEEDGYYSLSSYESYTILIN